MKLGDKLELSKMLNGGVEELFQEELNKVINNIDDVNTSPTAKRKIEIKIEIAPVKNRRAAMYAVEVNSKLAGREKQIGQIFIENGKALDYDTQQEAIDFPNIKPLNGTDKN